MRVCAEPGCHMPTHTTRCDLHRKQYRNQHDKHRPSSTQRGYDARWRKARANYLRFFPMCQHPSCIERATDVHHIDGQGPQGPNGYAWSNMQGLCHQHHSQITSKEQPGGFLTSGIGWPD